MAPWSSLAACQVKSEIQTRQPRIQAQGHMSKPQHIRVKSHQQEHVPLCLCADLLMSRRVAHSIAQRPGKSQGTRQVRGLPGLSWPRLSSPRPQLSPSSSWSQLAPFQMAGGDSGKPGLLRTSSSDRYGQLPCPEL